MANITKIFTYIGYAILFWFVLSVLLAWISISAGATALPLWNMLGLTLKIMSIV